MNGAAVSRLAGKMFSERDIIDDVPGLTDKETKGLRELPITDSDNAFTLLCSLKHQNFQTRAVTELFDVRGALFDVIIVVSTLCELHCVLLILKMHSHLPCLPYSPARSLICTVPEKILEDGDCNLGEVGKCVYRLVIKWKAHKQFSCTAHLIDSCDNKIDSAEAMVLVELAMTVELL